jgi:hypothetical protein
MSTDAPTPRSPADRLRDLRDELDRDARLLQVLTPGSEAHQRVSGRIEERTRQLLDRIDEMEESYRRHLEAVIAASPPRREAQLAERTDRRFAAVVCVIIGTGIAYVGWGTWWLAFGGVSLIIGLINLFAPDDWR